MKKKIIIGSLCIALLLALVPLSSVIGTHTAFSAEKKETSPLFLYRVKRATNQLSSKTSTRFLGQGTVLNFFLERKPLITLWIDKAIKIIYAKPMILSQVSDQLEKNPTLLSLLESYGLSLDQVQKRLAQAQQDPGILTQDLENAFELLGDSAKLPDVPQPTNFTGNIGCLFTIIIILPIIVMIATLIATITIFTCLNINGCFEKIFQSVIEGFSQNLPEP